MLKQNLTLKLAIAAAFALSACAKRTETPPPDSSKKTPAQTKSIPPSEEGQPMPDGAKTTPAPVAPVVPQETTPMQPPSPASPSTNGDVVVTPANKPPVENPAPVPVPVPAEPEPVQTTEQPAAKPGFFKGALQSIGGVLGSLIPFSNKSNEQTEPHSSDDVELEARRAQAKAADKDLLKIPTQPSDIVKIEAAIDHDTLVGPKLIKMLAAANTEQAMEVDKALVTDIFADGENNMDIQRAVADLNTGGLYNGDVQARVRILETMIDRRIFASERGVSWLRDGSIAAGIAAAIATTAQRREIKAMRRELAEGRFSTVEKGFQLAGTKTFSKPLAAEGHDLVVVVAAAEHVPLEALRQLQLVEEKQFGSLLPRGVVFKPTITPSLDIAVIDETMQEKLGNMRSIVLRYHSSAEPKADPGHNRLLFSQPMTEEKAAEIETAFTEQTGLFSGKMAADVPPVANAEEGLTLLERTPEMYDENSIPESQLPLHDSAKSLANPRPSDWSEIGGNKRFAKRFLLSAVPLAVGITAADAFEHREKLDVDEYYLESMIPKKSDTQP